MSRRFSPAVSPHSARVLATQAVVVQVGRVTHGTGAMRDTGAMTRTALGRATLLLVAAHLLHDLDHVRQGRSASAEVSVAAVLAWVSTILLVVLVARGHRLAPLF